MHQTPGPPYTCLVICGSDGIAWFRNFYAFETFMPSQPFYSSTLYFQISQHFWLRNRFPDFATSFFSANLQKLNQKLRSHLLRKCKLFLLSQLSVAKPWLFKIRTIKGSCEVRKTVAKSCFVAKSGNLTLENRRVAKPWKLRKQKSCESMRPLFNNHTLNRFQCLSVDIFRLALGLVEVMCHILSHS